MKKVQFIQKGLSRSERVAAGGSSIGYVGLENNAGTGILNAGGAYNMIVGTQSTNNLVLSNNAATHLTIDGSTGAVHIVGAISKGSGTFDIAHPDPSMPSGSRLRHSFVKSPNAGDNIYRWQIKIADNGKSFIKLPKYWNHLNTNSMVWVSSAEKPASAFGYVNAEREKAMRNPFR